jgi:hypothetical protein
MLCATAVDQAEQMVVHASNVEDLDLGITGNALIDTLSQLWNIREFRCKKWQMGVNFLQSALNGVSFETMLDSSCRYLADAVRIIQSSELDNDDIQQIKRLLKQADLDPYNVISSRE